MRCVNVDEAKEYARIIAGDAVWVLPTPMGQKL